MGRAPQGISLVSSLIKRSCEGVAVRTIFEDLCSERTFPVVGEIRLLNMLNLIRS